jgi:TRAP-type C4-dicarboxylate transport system substrate-binding protein
MADWVPDYEALVGPMLYAKGEEYSAICQTEFAKSLNRKAEDKGLKVLALDYNFGMRNVVMTKRQLRSFDDLQGVKIRVPKNALWIDTFNALGASPVGMGWGEVYNACQTGIIDAYESSISDTFDNQMNEVAKYVTRTAHFIGTGAVMMSKAVWDKLTPQQQQIMQEEFTRGAKYNNELVNKDEAEAQKKLEAQGMVFNDIDLAPFRQRAKSWFDNNKQLTPGVYDVITAELSKIRK